MRKEEERKKHNPPAVSNVSKTKEKYFQYNFKNPKQLERSTHFFKDTTRTHIRKKERIARALRCRACICNNKKK